MGSGSYTYPGKGGSCTEISTFVLLPDMHPNDFIDDGKPALQKRTVTVPARPQDRRYHSRKGRSRRHSLRKQEIGTGFWRRHKSYMHC